jgi:N6-adenosine-specific RNA methylase IME4
VSRYQIIYADPPWFYSNRSANRITKFGGGARAHYDVMKDKDILAMSDFVGGLADDNCALFLWCTCPRLDFGMETLKAWGFRYATVAFHWVKSRRNSLPIFGPGGYTASNLEVVLLGIKGSMPPKRRMIPSLVNWPRMRHSEKPSVVRDRIVQMYGDVPRIELFARHKVEGWDAWGDQVGIIIEHPKLRLEVAG